VTSGIAPRLEAALAHRRAGRPSMIDAAVERATRA